jgi:hypothetical protein
LAIFGSFQVLIVQPEVDAWPQARDAVVDLLRGDGQRDVEQRLVLDQGAAGQVGVGRADVRLASGRGGYPFARANRRGLDGHVRVALVVRRSPGAHDRGQQCASRFGQ